MAGNHCPDPTHPNCGAPITASEAEARMTRSETIRLIQAARYVLESWTRLQNASMQPNPTTAIAVANDRLQVDVEELRAALGEGS